MGGGKGKKIGMSQGHLTRQQFRESLPDSWDEWKKDSAILCIGDFTGHNYEDIRNNPKGLKATLIEDVLRLSSNKWLNKTIYRGICLTENEVRDLHEGKIIDQKGLSSWSDDFEIAGVFADSAMYKYSGEDYPVRVIFEDSATRNMDAMSIRSIARLSDENEVLRSSYSNQEVLSVEKRHDVFGSYYHVKIREVI